jgi:HSP20 family molecular chaperone IbpA
MDRLFDDSFFRAPARLFDEGMLPVEISETEADLLVRASLPGFDCDEIDVNVNKGVLSIKGEHT